MVREAAWIDTNQIGKYDSNGIGSDNITYRCACINLPSEIGLTDLAA